MLVDPTQPLDLKEHLQHKKQLFLDENEMVSSDLLNVTARVSNVSLRVPSAVEKDVRSCDILVDVGEVMLVVSSALPRTFLTGKIGLSVFGDESSRDGPSIVFPNDPSDVCYELERSEDPSIRQLGQMTSKHISTFRCQLTIRGFNVRLSPVIPYCNVEQCQELLAPVEMTMLFCFEGEPSDDITNEAGGYDNTAPIKIALFFSMQIHKLIINVDFDTITGAISTTMHHYDTIHATMESLLKVFAPSLELLKETTTNDDDLNGMDGPLGDDAQLQRTMAGRRILVKRQIKRSRETGGLSLAFCSQLAEFHFNVWRQNVPVMSRFRASMADGKVASIEEAPIPLLHLLHAEAKTAEFGLEGCLQGDERRIVSKLHLVDAALHVCDFDGESERFRASAEDQEDKGALMVQIFGLGGDARSTNERVKEKQHAHQDVLLRVEERKEGKRSMAISAELLSGTLINLHIHELENFFLLLVEGLLMPTTKSPRDMPQNSDILHFPDGSIGALLTSFLPSVNIVDTGLRKLIGSEDKEVFQFDEEAIDNVLEKVVLDNLPDDVSHMLFRLETSDITVVVPHRPVLEKDMPEIPWFALWIHEIAILTAYFDGGASSATNTEDAFNLVSSLATKNRAWKDLVPSNPDGIYHNIKLRQSLHAADNNGSKPVMTETLVPPFDLASAYYPSAVNFSMNDTMLTFQDLYTTKALRVSLLAFINRCIVLKTRVQTVLEALVHFSQIIQKSAESTEKLSSTIGNIEGKEGGHSALLAQLRTEFETSIDRSRVLLGKMKGRLSAYQGNVVRVVSSQQQEMDFLRYEVFVRERERLAAIAFSACQASGWLRAGGIHMFGSRAPTTSTMWRYHVTLRMNLLIFYDGPNKVRK